MQIVKHRQLWDDKSLRWEPHWTRNEEFGAMGHFLEHRHAIVLIAKEKEQAVGTQDIDWVEVVTACDNCDTKYVSLD